MSKENHHEELPSITVGSLSSNLFSMPCASELAYQRAQKELCEIQIRQLREEHEKTISTASGSHSSESESEAMLSAVVEPIEVTPLVPTDDAQQLEMLLVSLLSHMSDTVFFDASLETLRDLPYHGACDFTKHLLEGVCTLIQNSATAREQWAMTEVVGVGAWLCAALVSREGRHERPQIARATHLLLNEVATKPQVEALGEVLMKGVTDPRALLEIADGVRNGSAVADVLADALVCEVLENLLGEHALLEKGREKTLMLWWRLCVRDKYLALQAAGRAALGPAARAAYLLICMLAESQSSSLRSTIEFDTLKVREAASKLEVMFRDKK